MKMMTVILLLGFMQVSASVFGQEEIVSIGMRNAEVSKIFAEIEKQVGFSFMYHNDDINKLGKVDINMSEAKLKNVLAECLKNSDLDFEIIKNLIIIKRSEAKASAIQQAKKTIKGIVTDADGNSLPGVSVFVKGTNTGVATDIDGKFEFKIADKKGLVLVFSFVGMLTQEVPYKGQSELKVIMKSDSEQLEEVVVTGLQTLSRERAAGSFSQIDNKAIEQRISANIVENLEGAVSGLYVDGENKISIRGVGTLYGDSSPLIVVDGFPVEADLSTINPEDVKNIQVLKDASATSVWGVRAANGVIVITTKMGKQSEKVNINASYYMTIEEKPDLHSLDVLSATDHIDYKLETISKGDFDPLYVFPDSQLGPIEQALYNQYLGLISQTDVDNKIAQLRKVDSYAQMEKHLLRKAVSNKLTMSLSGGSDKNSYYASLTYTGNKEYTVGDKSSQINFNIKNDYKLSEKLKLFTAANITVGKSTNNGVSLNSMYFYPIYKPIVDENGNPIRYYMIEENKGKELEEQGYLPYTESIFDEMNETNNETKTFNARIQAGLNYKIFPGMVFDTKFQYERGFTKNDHLQSPNHPRVRKMVNTFTNIDPNGNLTYVVPPGHRLFSSKNDQEAWTWRNQISYNGSFSNNKHQISAILGTEVRKYVTYGFRNEKWGYDPQTLDYFIMDEKLYTSNALKSMAWYGYYYMSHNPLTSFTEVDNRDVSMYCNAAYTFNQKYTANISARVDQSNLFGGNDEYKYKPLWSMGLNWKISDEDFLKDVEWIDNLALRATYGVGGNANKGFYPVLMGTVQNSIYGRNKYINLSNPANEDLKWESSYMTNFGIDWSILSRRLWGSIEVYNKDSKDIIGRMSLENTNGWNSASFNFASMNNKGFEISLNGIPYKTKNFKWESNLNIAHNKNKVVEVGVNGATPNNYLNDLPSIEMLDFYLSAGWGGSIGIPIIGQPLDRVYAYKWGGLDDNGNPMIYNENNELIPFTEDTRDPKALKYMGTSTPTFYGNLNNTFSYKGLSLTVNLSYKFGHVFRANRTVVSAFYNVIHSNIKDRWIQPGEGQGNDINKGKNVPGYEYPAFFLNTRDNYYSNADINVLKGDLIRLRDISLSYNLPENILGKTPFKSLNIKAQARNLWLWTANKENIDPDKTAEFAMPTPKSFVLGIKATF